MLVGAREGVGLLTAAKRVSLAALHERLKGLLESRIPAGEGASVLRDIPRFQAMRLISSSRGVSLSGHST